ncbi:MAG: aminopeptidase P family protein [Clostridia bacterium]|nr:aminopeptidase P family protein [Clostridia bacterium]
MTEKLNNFLEKCDAIYITSPHNLRYFTGFKGGEGTALVGKSFKYLFVDSRYTTQAQIEAPNFEVIEFTGGKKNAEIKAKLEKHHILSVCFEDEQMSYAEYSSAKNSFSNVEFQGISKELSMLRMVKTKDELDNLRKAEQIGVDAFLKVLPLLEVGTAETDIAAELEYQMRKLGASGAAFDTIVVSGIKTSMPHGKPNSKKLENGDFVTMDFGCRYNGYCSDMTRTVVIGKATDEQKKIYQTVKQAQEVGLLAIKAGVSGKDADFAAREIIEKAGYGKYFGHSLGHGVGLLIHELPNLSPLSNIKLEAGMIVTCEPGIYVPDLGGVRIEDMVCVTEDGIENLTHLDKELLEL